MANLMRCDSCEAIMIQGIFCHETGCPNTHSRYDVESGEWVKQRECRECGCTIDEDDECCNGEFEADSDSYYHVSVRYNLGGKTVTNFEIIDHGEQNSQYFQGCGTSFTSFDECVTGIGDNYSEALNDCHEQIAMNGADNTETITDGSEVSDND